MHQNTIVIVEEDGTMLSLENGWREVYQHSFGHIRSKEMLENATRFQNTDLNLRWIMKNEQPDKFQGVGILIASSWT